MKGKYIAIFAVFVFIVSFFSMEARAADWKYVGADVAGCDWFYDTQSVSRGQDTVRVWIKWILSGKGKVGWIKELPEIKGIENISYTIGRNEINCSKNVYRTTSMALYGSEGFIFVADYPDSQFKDVIPDSIYTAVVKAICEKKEEGK